MTPEEEQFLKEHRFCVISTLRKSGSPFATPVYYFYDEGKLYVSITKTRSKTAHVLRDSRVTLCALHEEPPFNYVQVQGTAIISEEELEPRTRRIFSLFSTPLREDFSTMLEEQQRQLMVITPTQVTSRLIVPGAR